MQCFNVNKLLINCTTAIKLDIKIHFPLAIPGNRKNVILLVPYKRSTKRVQNT